MPSKRSRATQPTTAPRNPDPNDIASEARKPHIPQAKKCYSLLEHTSVLFQKPAYTLFFPQIASNTHPHFHVTADEDPVNFALKWATLSSISVGFICMANENKPGGHWEVSDVLLLFPISLLTQSAIGFEIKFVNVISLIDRLPWL